jgi:hypothetical protein
MELSIGFEPIAVRQQIALAKQFTGVAPLLGALKFVLQSFSLNRYDYGTPDGTVPMTKVGDDGGIFTFPTGAVVTEVRMTCGAGSVISMYVEELDGSSPIEIGTGIVGVANRYVMSPEGLPVLPSQRLRILETVKGVPAAGNKSLSVYAVKRGRMP